MQMNIQVCDQIRADHKIECPNRGKYEMTPMIA